MNALALLALFFFASSKTRTSSAATLQAPRRRVEGKSGNTWFVSDSTQLFGSDRTSVMSTQVFASASGADLVIAYVTVPADAIVFFGDGGKPQKAKSVRVLFYAAPSSLTKAAQADFTE